MVHDGKTQDGLEMLFAQARSREASEASPDLMARVLADAAQVQAELAQQSASAPSQQMRKDGGIIAGVLSAMGGWFAASGVVAAGMAGLVLGFYIPDQVDMVLNGQVSSFIGEDAANLLPGFDGLMAMAE